MISQRFSTTHKEELASYEVKMKLETQKLLKGGIMRKKQQTRDVMAMVLIGILILWLSLESRAQTTSIKGMSGPGNLGHNLTVSKKDFLAPGLNRKPRPVTSAYLLSPSSLHQENRQIFQVRKVTFSENYEIGFLDGNNYHRTAGSFWGGFGFGLFVPFTYGISTFGALAIALTNPRNFQNPKNPNNHLLSDPGYLSGFAEGARKRKRGKTFTGFGIGVGTGLVIGITAVIIVLSNFGAS